MPDQPADADSKKRNQLIREFRQTLDAHRAFLQAQNENRVEAPLSALELRVPAPESPPALFTHADLVEFATGSMAKCFGEEFAVFENRRHPRIPNSALLMMSRIVSIQATRKDFRSPASIQTEFEIPAGAWFLRNNPQHGLPVSVLLETALQPCGFLSAWMGTMLMHPEVNYLFRNLDGEATLHDPTLTSGKLTCNVELTSTTENARTIIQRFNFRLENAGKPVFSGWSVFGFFPPEMMVTQAGIPACPSNLFHPHVQASPTSLPADPAGHLSALSLAPLDQLVSLSSGAERGSAWGTYRNDPGAWFYPCHFYGDPVMPGSLGVEAVFRMLTALAMNNLPPTPQTHLLLPAGMQLQWKYRGQVLQKHQEMGLFLEYERRKDATGTIFVAPRAYLGVDGKCIYEIRNAAVRLA